jgi:PAT family beta-lactamase induction signal transducer AmpG
VARDTSDPVPARSRDEGLHAAAAAYAPPRDQTEAADAPGDAGAPAGEGVEDARRGLPWAISTYFAEGLPFSIIHQVSAELFTAFGASLAVVGYTSLYGLASNLKFLWSPLVDRYGTLRRWIVAVELLLAAVLVVIATRASPDRLRSVGLALVLVAFLSATQDIAVDGYYLAALDKPAQASLSGTRVGAYRVALLVGKSGLVALAGFTSWSVCFLAAAAIMASLSAFHAFALRPIRGTASAKKSDTPGPLGAVRAFVGSFRSFLAKPRIVATLAFILAFKAGDALMFNMSVPFMKSLGLDTDMRGVLSAPSLIASVAGTMAGGFAIRRLSLARTIVPITFLQCVAIPLYALLATLRPSFAAIAVAVSIEQFVAGIGNAALLVFLMRRAEGEHKTAHFAIGTALMTVPTTLAGLVSGDLAQALGFTSFFLLAFVLALPGVLIARHVPTD